MSLGSRFFHTDAKAFSWMDLCKAYWFLLGRLKAKWLVLTVFLFTINFYVVVPPFILGKIVDFFTGFRSGDSLQFFHFYTIVLGITFVIFSFVRLSLKNALGNLQSEVMYQTKVSGFEKLLDFSLAWHLEESAGAKAQRIKNGVEAYEVLNRRLNNEIITSVVSIIGTAAVFLFLRPQYVIFFFCYVVGFWSLLVYFNHRIQKENDAYFLSLEKAGGSYVEGLSNILTIKALGAAGGFKQHIASKEIITKDYEVSIRRLSINLWKSFQIFNGVCYALFLFLVGQDVVTGQITVGSLIIFYGYLQYLIAKAADFLDVYEKILNAKSGIGRMMDIFWTKVSIMAGKKKFPKAWDAILLNHANFAYKSRGTIKDVSITIPRYAKVGIVGKTGSGKSTIAKILAGLYSLSSGDYTIGSTSFYQLAHEEQTKQLTLVLQETEIFNLSLLDNMTLMRKVDPELLETALEISQLRELVANLPEGLDTLVGERGYHLSGGERQRVGIARAICKNAPIMIFDEATSSVDSKTEFLIQQGLETRLKEKTIISIAHRVSTLQKTDIIYVFDEGRIVEQGTFSELSANKTSKFNELYQSQQSK